jgi:hypothetical protein
MDNRIINLRTINNSDIRSMMQLLVQLDQDHFNNRTGDFYSNRTAIRRILYSVSILSIFSYDIWHSRKF